jgi:iron complex outermembrane receptor protein
VLNPVLLGIESDIGQFRFSLVGNRLDRLTMIPTLGAEQVDERTTAYAPKWQTSFDTTWYYHGLTVNYGYSYFSKTTRYSLLEIAAQPDIASPDNIYYDAFQQHDLHVAYDFDDAYQVYAGVRNFTDERPDYSTTYPISAVGRFVYGGFRVNFGL